MEAGTLVAVRHKLPIPPNKIWKDSQKHELWWVAIIPDEAEMVEFKKEEKRESSTRGGEESLQLLAQSREDARQLFEQAFEEIGSKLGVQPHMLDIM